jgi:ATP-dependent Clp protease protease subunit
MMIHQPMGGFRGSASDVEIQAREIIIARERLYDIIASHTGKKSTQVAKDADRDKYFSPEEARDYGLIDEIISTAKAAAKKE